MFGVLSRGETGDQFIHVAPAEGEVALFGFRAATHPSGLCDAQRILEASRGVEVLGQSVFLYADPTHPNHFASIRVNAPGIRCSHPALALNRFARARSSA